MGLVSPTFDFRPIQYQRGKRFAFSYLFQDIGTTINYCHGTYEFTPVSSSYVVTLSRASDGCFAEVVDANSKAPVELIERSPRLPFDENGAWCKVLE